MPCDIPFLKNSNNVPLLAVNVVAELAQTLVGVSVGTLGKAYTFINPLALLVTLPQDALVATQ